MEHAHVYTCEWYICMKKCLCVETCTCVYVGTRGQLQVPFLSSHPTCFLRQGLSTMEPTCLCPPGLLVM